MRRILQVLIPSPIQLIVYGVLLAGLLIVFSGSSRYVSDSQVDQCEIRRTPSACDYANSMMNFYGGPDPWEQIKNGTYDWTR